MDRSYVEKIHGRGSFEIAKAKREQVGKDDLGEDLGESKGLRCILPSPLDPFYFLRWNQKTTYFQDWMATF